MKAFFTLINDLLDEELSDELVADVAILFVHAHRVDAKLLTYEQRDDQRQVDARLPEKEWWPLRARVLERDGHACRYCGDREKLCVDHVVPLSRGGTNHQVNLVACCMPCNSSKSDRLLSEWEGRLV